MPDKYKVVITVVDCISHLALHLDLQISQAFNIVI